jgi:hypothetical protein
MWLLQSQPNSAWVETEQQFGNPDEDELEENKAFKRSYDSDEENDREMEEEEDIKVDSGKINAMVKSLFRQIVNLLVDRRRLVRQKAKDAIVSILQLKKPGIIKQARYSHQMQLNLTI